LAEQPQRYLNAQVGLPGSDAFGVEEPFEVGGSRVGGVQLGKRRRDE
jgi:hypothetical protein